MYTHACVAAQEKEHLQVINKGAQALRGANLVLKVKTQPLHAGAVGHPGPKGGGVGVGHVPDGRVGDGVRGQGRVDAHRPAARGLLVLVGQDKVVQQLGGLGVGRVLEDSGVLGPGDKGGGARGGGKGRVDVVARGHLQVGARREAGGFGLVGRAEDGVGRGGAADPAGVLGEEALEPGLAELLDAVVVVSRFLLFTDGVEAVVFLDLHKVELPQDGVIIVGVGQDQLVLELGLEEVLVRRERGIRELVRVPEQAPREDVDAVVAGGAAGVLEGRVDLVEAEGRVVEQGALVGPARVVVQRLQDDAVDVDVVVRELVVEVAVVVLGQVDGDVERHARELGLEGGLEGVLLRRLVAAVPAGHDAALGQGGLVDLVERAALDGCGGVIGGGQGGLAQQAREEKE